MARKAKAAVQPAESAEAPAKLIAYKGFNQDWTCRGYQYEVGKTYVHDGDVEACKGGFHACEHPLNVFDYYASGLSRYAEVEMGGKLSRHDSDTKVASAEITIKAELKIPDLVARAIKYVFDRSTPEGETATGDQGAASATGDQGAASATGYQGAASATGDQGAASATGYQGAASATGDQGAAMSAGRFGRVSGAIGNALFLVERNSNYEIVAVWAGIVGRDGIEPDVFYTLENGKPVKDA